MQNQRLNSVIESLRSHSGEARGTVAAGRAAVAERFRELLEQLLDAQSLIAGRVWLSRGEGSLQLVCERGFSALPEGQARPVPPAVRERLTSAIVEGQSARQPLRPDGILTDGEPVGLFVPLYAGKAPGGVLELYASSRVPPTAHAELLRDLEEIAEFCSGWLDRADQETVDAADCRDADRRREDDHCRAACGPARHPRTRCARDDGE